MSKRITIEELQSYLWNSAVLLRTNIDAGAYKQYIFPLLFFKRICDVYDEETAAALEEYGDDAAEFDEDEIHTFIVPKGYHWNDVRAISENVGVAIVEAFRKVENANSDKLQGIFGDGAWTNKNRLPDRLLKDLLEHFSTKTLSIANCPEDELGQGYEYLIKKFADDSGHTAQEFYTNRTVVHLMTEMLKPESGESIYDPTCGSAGMLISAIAYLKAQGKEWRNVAVYGQEINALTSAIGKMNLFLHGVKDFSIVNGDTLASPAFIEHGRLQQFDLVLANPPYSISQWDRAAFESDKYGRNFLGVPPQGRADYAFLQHIIASLKEDTGRCAILFPHGVLFRNEESAMRERLVRSDRVECVIGLGPNLFYNSPMEACIMICRNNVICIPIAAGVLSFDPINVTLNPMIAAGAMSLSSVCVVLNALRLNLVNLNKHAKRKKPPVNFDVNEVIQAVKSNESAHKYGEQTQTITAENTQNIEVSGAENQAVTQAQGDIASGNQTISAQNNQKEGNTMQKTISIEGMMCMHCVKHVKDALSKVSGVTEVEVSLDDKNAVVTLATNVDDSVLKSAVENAGYDVKGIK